MDSIEGEGRKKEKAIQGSQLGGEVRGVLASAMSPHSRAKAWLREEVQSETLPWSHGGCNGHRSLGTTLDSLSAAHCGTLAFLARRLSWAALGGRRVSPEGEAHWC